MILSTYHAADFVEAPLHREATGSAEGVVIQWRRPGTDSDMITATLTWRGVNAAFVRALQLHYRVGRLDRHAVPDAHGVVRWFGYAAPPQISPADVGSYDAIVNLIPFPR